MPFVSAITTYMWYFLATPSRFFGSAVTGYTRRKRVATPLGVWLEERVSAWADQFGGWVGDIRSS